MDQIKSLGPNGVRVILVANKIDLGEERVVTYKAGFLIRT